MDPHELEDAKARLERDYIAGSITADEYTRFRRQLEEDAAAPATGDPAPAPEAVTSEPMPPLATHDDSGVVPERGDPVAGAALATWGRRAGGWCVDLLVYIAAFTASFLIALPTEDPETGEISDGAAVLIVVVWFFGPTLYQWLMVGRWGRTLGKMAVGITVVRSEDGARVSYPRALGRAASAWLLGVLVIPILLSYLWPLWDRRNQTIHDKMASTIVVSDT